MIEKSRKILLGWGFIWLFLWLLVSMFLGPRAETAPAQEKGAHGHALCLSFLVLIIGLAQSYIALSDGVRIAFTVLLCFGSFLLPIGVLFEIVSKTTGVIFAILGGVLVVVSTLAFMVGALKFRPSQE